MAKEGMKPQEGQKMTAEQLVKVVQELSTQNSYLKTQAQTMQQKIIELSNFAMFKRLDYCFEVLKNSSKFPEEFVKVCTEEIMDTMTITPEETADSKKEE